jgi:hypothetical protein
MLGQLMLRCQPALSPRPSCVVWPSSVRCSYLCITNGCCFVPHNVGAGGSACQWCRRQVCPNHFLPLCGRGRGCYLAMHPGSKAGSISHLALEGRTVTRSKPRTGKRQRVLLQLSWLG